VILAALIVALFVAGMGLLARETLSAWDEWRGDR
jgi:hypothetical protein